jgi:deoxyribodipyrimidine photo-lyase
MGIAVDANSIIVWFRRDLRVADNPALLYAARSGQPVVPLYVAGWEDEDAWAPGAVGRWWLQRSLGHLKASLSSLGAPLCVAHGKADEVIPRLARMWGAEEVVWNRLYEPYVHALDLRVADSLEKEGLRARTFNAGLLFEPEGHLSRSGRPFVQFTAYWRSCLALPGPDGPDPEPHELIGLADSSREATDALQSLTDATRGGAHRGQRVAAEGLPFSAPGWEPRTGSMPAWKPGELGARARLERFVEQALAGYALSRDLPGVDGTSQLSPHLHFGEIGPRQVWQAMLRVEQVSSASGAGTPSGAT